MLINVTDKALAHMKNLLAGKEPAPLGLRFGTAEKGCSGLSYVVDYVTDPEPTDEVVDVGDIKLFIEKESLLYLLGSTIDYEEGQFSSGFVFLNPNEKSRCGCGESFNV